MDPASRRKWAGPRDDAERRDGTGRPAGGPAGSGGSVAAAPTGAACLVHFSASARNSFERHDSICARFFSLSRTHLFST